MSQDGNTAVIYHYFEKDETYRENFIFFLARAWRSDLEFFIVISGEHSVDLPVRGNIQYVYTRNFGHDFGSYAAVTESGALDAFDRLIFVNCSVRGPFLPQYSTGCWTHPFLSLLEDDVHLCGSSINILHDTRPFHALYRQGHPNDPEPFSHVQSSAHAMTAKCFAFLRAQNLYADAIEFDKERAVVDCEIAMSLLVRSNGWNIACLLPPYNALDYRAPHSDINPATTTGHPQAKGAYFGLTAHPFELVFIKTEWKLLSKEARDFYSLMALQYHPVPSLNWVEAKALRDQFATRLGGPLAALPLKVRQGLEPEPVNTAAQPASPQARCILVLGMHRSGTSALAGVLTHLGVTQPNTPMEPHASNPKGFFESVRVRDFNDALLAAAGSSWKDWRPIPQDWFSSAEAQAFQEAACAVVDDEYGTSKLFALKDPRICRLFPFWRTVLEKRGTMLLPLLTHRNPREVAGSLADRYNFHPAFTHLLWLGHLLEAEAASRGLKRHFTSYDLLLNDVAAEAKKIALSFDLPLPDDQAVHEMGEFLSSDLHNHRTSAESRGNGLAPWYHKSLAIFEHWARAGWVATDQTTLDFIRVEFDRTVPVFDSIVTERRVATSPP